jgi:hypothetical protein
MSRAVENPELAFNDTFCCKVEILPGKLKCDKATPNLRKRTAICGQRIYVPFFCRPLISVSQISGSWFRASAITTINKTNKMHNSL